MSYTARKDLHDLVDALPPVRSRLRVDTRST
jgi:hypothetical protein